MNLLKKDNCLVYVLLTFLTFGAYAFVIANDLDLYENDAWYTKWYYWILGALLLFIPDLIMLIVLNIEMQIKICLKLNVPGKEYYAIPYTWLLSLIIPLIGWSSFIVMLIHIYYYPAVMIYKGEGEK